MEYIPIAAYVVSEQNNKKFKSQKLSCVSVEAKENSDVKAFQELPKDEQIELQNYIELLFKHNRGLKEVEFRYKTISMIATRTM